MDKVKPGKRHVQKKIKDAIILLNDIVKTRLAPSQIHGIGVFAMRDLKKGEKLYLDAIPHAFDLPYAKFKRLNRDVAQIILSHWPQVINGSHFLYPVTKMSAFLNHENDANYDAKEDVTLKAIKAGEEITEDYRVIEGYEKIFPWIVEK